MEITMRIRKTHNLTQLTAVAVLSLFALVPACSMDDPCSAGETFRDGYCYPTDAAAPVNNAIDASPGVDGGAGSAFGQTCATTADCPPPTTFCAPTINYCTALGCDADPTLCPAGWSCMDLTSYGLAARMCVRP